MKKYRGNLTKFDSAFGLQFLVSLYLSLIFILILSKEYSSDLLLENPFMIGEATAKGISVSARISAFYKVVLFGLGFFGTTFLLFDRTLKSFFRSVYRKKMLAIVLVLQISLSILGYFSQQSQMSGGLLHFVVIGLLLLEFSEIYFNKRSTFFNDEVLKSVFLVMISLSLLIENIFIAGTVFILILGICHIKSFKKALNPMFFILTALPLMLFLTVEITLILNQNGLYNVHYWWVGMPMFLLFVFVAICAKLHQKDVAKLIYNWQAPVLILSATIFVAYSPVYPPDNSLFEIANNLNPLMMSEVHQTTYFLDYISSHLLSDYVWLKLYSALNGYSNEVAPMIYYAFSWMAYSLFIYYFLKQYFQSHFGIIIFMLFSPFLYFYLPNYAAISLFPLIFLHRYFLTKKTSNLWWFGLLSTLTLFWRIDTGVATLGSALIVFFILFLVEKSTRASLLKIGLALTVFYGLLFVVYYQFCSDLIQQAFHYFGGSQGHGLSLLTEEKSNVFYFDYFILPCIIGLAALFLLFRYNTIKNKPFFWTTIFLIGFYFFNVQRGLVRHSFIEQNESYITSFGWLILVLISIEFFQKKRQIQLWLGITIGGFFLSIHSVENVTALIDKNKSFSVNQLPEITGEMIDRSPRNNDYELYLKPAVSFLKGSLEKGETFFDFSNSPMLYYHSEQKLPTYFCQSLQYVVDFYLQQECVALMEKQSMPFVVFDQIKPAFGDNIDNVPNKVRYYFIASHILDNYTPYKPFGLFNIWKRKNNVSNLTDSLSHQMVQPEHWNLGKMPFYWKSNVDEPILKHVRNINVLDNHAQLGVVKHGDFLFIKLKSPKNTTLKLKMENDDNAEFMVILDVVAGSHEYKFPICGSYFLRNAHNPNITFELNEDIQIEKVAILNQLP